MRRRVDIEQKAPGRSLLRVRPQNVKTVPGCFQRGCLRRCSAASRRCSACRAHFLVRALHLRRPEEVRWEESRWASNRRDAHRCSFRSVNSAQQQVLSVVHPNCGPPALQYGDKAWETFPYCGKKTVLLHARRRRPTSRPPCVRGAEDGWRRSFDSQVDVDRTMVRPGRGAPRPLLALHPVNRLARPLGVKVSVDLHDKDLSHFVGDSIVNLRGGENARSGLGSRRRLPGRAVSPTDDG
jgi:hypothetical protein